MRPALEWGARQRAQQVAIVGATGAVGLELVRILLAAGHSPGSIACLARSAGALECDGARLPVGAAPASPAGYRGQGLVFLCTPSGVSRELAPAIAAEGVLTIDLSSAHRTDPRVPLVVPEINGAELDAEFYAGRAGGAPRLVANPNCTTAIACMPLAVVARLAGLSEVVVVSYQAASGAGAAGLEALRSEARADCGLAPDARRPSPFPATLALNVIPAVADVAPDGTSGEEQKIVDETRRILGLPELVVEATTARVPVERCHSVALHVRTQRPLDLGQLLAALRAAPGIALSEDPHGPRPRECAGTDPVHVGRVRAGRRGRDSLALFAVGDQLRKGAALNALQIAARLVGQG